MILENMDFLTVSRDNLIKGAMVLFYQRAGKCANSKTDVILNRHRAPKRLFDLISC